MYVVIYRRVKNEMYITKLKLVKSIKHTFNNIQVEISGIPLVCSKVDTGPMAPPSFGCGFPKIVPKLGIIIMHENHVENKIERHEKKGYQLIYKQKWRCAQLFCAIHCSGFQCNFTWASQEDVCGGRSNALF